MSRLPQQPLEWIDRSEEVSFEFEGQVYRGFKGDVISSALWAQEVKLLGRSFKYHRPRGILSLANHDVNALFQEDSRPNVRGDVVTVENGMALKAVNTFGSLQKDKGTAVEWIAKFLPVGFYYRAFYSPRLLFPKWEAIIRTMAGLGKVNTQWTEERKAKRYHYCDVAVIGAGPAGLSAALKAAEEGADVCLIDENPQIGGALDYQYVNEASITGQAKSLKRAVLSHSKITVLTDSYVAGYYGDHWLSINAQNGLIKMNASSVVVATGVFEQPAVFRNNDLPGVMNASAAQRLVARYAVSPGEKLVILTANPEGYRAALDMHQAGIEIVAILDTAACQHEWATQAKDAGLIIHHYVTPIEALGRQSVKGFKVELDKKTAQFECDSILMSVGWAPAGAPIYQAKGQFAYNVLVQQLVPTVLPSGLFACGRVNGVFEIQDQFKDGEQAGRAAASAAFAKENVALIDYRSTAAHSHPYPIWAHPKGKNFIDLDEDIQLKDLKGAVAQGFDNVELLKRFSTLGMGPSQGKHSNMNGIRILAKLTHKTIDETGSTTSRPMFHPTPVSHLAGLRFRPERLTALHKKHLVAKAQFMEAGNWLRPEFYQTASDRQACIDNEVFAVRQKVGVIDVSTLGKLNIFGADAPELMDRLYTMRMSNMKVGASRYALMVDDTGVITDDGVAVRLEEELFYVTTTTTSSDNAYRLIQRKIIEWGLDATVINRTGQVAAMNLAGPRSRDVLSTLTDIDLSSQAFPYLGMKQAMVLGKDAILIRVGFVGELGYEIHLAEKDAVEIWDAILAAGDDYGIQPFGVEAQRQLRLEKGHIIVGQDTDGLMNPFEANMPWAVHAKKDHFIGKPSLVRLKELKKRQLVGFELVGKLASELPKESNLIIEQGQIVGRITSIGHSGTLQKWIGLADVQLPYSKKGSVLHIKLTSGKIMTGRVVSLPFYDPEGAKQLPVIEGESV